MTEPPYVDDLTITNDSVLWRRIIPQWIVPDSKKPSGWRPSSAAFDDSQDRSPMSVFLAEVVFATGRTSANLLTGFDGYGLVSLTAEAVRAQRQGVAPAPEPKEPAHAFVFGNKSSTVKRKLADSANWIHLPR
jgi:hypothetical protein